jgi:hypothetical protein
LTAPSRARVKVTVYCDVRLAATFFSIP